MVLHNLSACMLDSIMKKLFKITSPTDNVRPGKLMYETDLRSGWVIRQPFYLQVKSDYEQLRETCTSVIQERDSALRERTQLQDRLQQLEQVKTHTLASGGQHSV